MNNTNDTYINNDDNRTKIQKDICVHNYFMVNGNETTVTLRCIHCNHKIITNITHTMIRKYVN